MNELKMTFNQIRNETVKAFQDGYDHPEDMKSCADAADQEFHCCGNDCTECNGNNECSICSDCSSNTTETSCTDENMSSCIIERIWEMSEHTPPLTIADEHGSDVHYVKIIRITKNYRNQN